MKKEDRELDRLERKLKIENLERCLNCKSFLKCTLLKEEVSICSSFEEIPLKKQLIIVNLKAYSRLKGTKNLSLCSFC